MGLLNKASLTHVQLVVQKCEADEDEQQIIEELLANGIDGLILPPPFCDAREVVDLITSTGVPAVAVASGQPDQRLSAVSIDDRLAAYEMTRHLLSLGHQRLGFIIGHPNQTASARRLAGFREAMADAGLAIDERLVVQASSATAPASNARSGGSSRRTGSAPRDWIRSSIWFPPVISRPPRPRPSTSPTRTAARCTPG